MSPSGGISYLEVGFPLRCFQRLSLPNLATQRGEQIVKERQAVLMAAYEKHPERFKGKMPKPMNLPDAVWINKPEAAQSEPAQH